MNCWVMLNEGSCQKNNGQNGKSLKIIHKGELFTWKWRTNQGDEMAKGGGGHIDLLKTKYWPY